MPKVSIITASYNYAEYISETINSVINQSFQDWEMIIIDDGSKDDSINTINKFVKNDNRIRLLMHYNNENKGLVETLKLGINNAQGEYIVFLESDDYIKENYLEKKLEIFEAQDDVGFVYNDVQTFGTEQNITQKRYFWLVRHYWRKHDYAHFISDMFYMRNYVPTFSCVMLKKELLEGINWEPYYAACVDWWIWAQISKKTKYYCIPQKLTYWRLHNDSYLNLSQKKEEDPLLFLSGLYELLPPMKRFGTKIKFILKQLYMLIKYRENTIKYLKHIIK